MNIEALECRLWTRWMGWVSKFALNIALINLPSIISWTPWLKQCHKLLIVDTLPIRLVVGSFCYTNFFNFFFLIVLIRSICNRWVPLNFLKDIVLLIEFLVLYIHLINNIHISSFDHLCKKLIFSSDAMSQGPHMLLLAKWWKLTFIYEKYNLTLSYIQYVLRYNF